MKKLYHAVNDIQFVCEILILKGDKMFLKTMRSVKTSVSDLYTRVWSHACIRFVMMPTIYIVFCQTVISVNVTIVQNS